MIANFAKPRATRKILNSNSILYFPMESVPAFPLRLLYDRMM